MRRTVRRITHEILHKKRHENEINVKQITKQMKFFNRTVRNRLHEIKLLSFNSSISKKKTTSLNDLKLYNQLLLKEQASSGIRRNSAGFDPSFKRPTCLATLKSCDTTKQSVCE